MTSESPEIKKHMPCPLCGSHNGKITKEKIMGFTEDTVKSLKKIHVNVDEDKWPGFWLMRAHVSRLQKLKAKLQ